MILAVFFLIKKKWVICKNWWFLLTIVESEGIDFDIKIDTIDYDSDIEIPKNPSFRILALFVWPWDNLQDNGCCLRLVINFCAILKIIGYIVYCHFQTNQITGFNLVHVFRAWKCLIQSVVNINEYQTTGWLITYL